MEQLTGLIMSGALLAGQPLRQDELAARFGVSRTPLREAIARLEVEGLVVAEKHRGAVVFRPSTQELQEIYEIRILLEPKAAALAAAKYASLSSRLTELAEINESMEDAATWDYAQLNNAFHMGIYEASGQRRLCRIIRNLRLQADPYVAILFGVGGGPRALEDHREILAAVANGDSVGASELTRSHLETTVSRVMPLVTRLNVQEVSSRKVDGIGREPAAPARGPLDAGDRYRPKVES